MPNPTQMRAPGSRRSLVRRSPKPRLRWLMRASIPTRQLRSRQTAGSAPARPGLAQPSLALQPDPPNATLGQRTVVGGGPEPAVVGHRARHPNGDLRDAVDGPEQLRRVRRVALLEPMVGDQVALVFNHQRVEPNSVGLV